jgi:hypothetical protein
MCGVTQALGGSQRAGKWPEKLITYRIANQHPLVEKKVWEGEFEWALKAVSSVFDLDFERVDRGGNIVYSAANLGGQGGVLGLTELIPPGVRRNKDFTSNLKIDALDRFSAEDQAQIAMSFDLGEVNLHELLHALGLYHITARGIIALLNPQYNPSISGLQKADIEEMLDVGYALRVQPLPPVVPPNQQVPARGRPYTTALSPGQSYTAKGYAVAVDYVK